MNKKIYESFYFLLTEYKRLRIKDKNTTITKEEKETLKKLTFFIDRKRNE